MASYDALLKPFRLKNIVLRNRVMSTAHASGLAEDGMPAATYQAYHGEKARGGIGLTIFGGSSSVAIDSPLTFNQIDMSHDRVLPHLERMAEVTHRHGAAVMVQITHLGRRGNWRNRHWLPIVGPSASREIAHRSFAKEMEDFDFARIIKAFADAAERAQKSGLDGVEVIAAAHHLIDSFLSPAVNERTDRYGGSLENRARFGLEVMAAIRDRVGPDFIVGMRISGDEMVAGGLSAADCVEVARLFAASGLIDFLSIYQGSGDTLADLPIFHASGIRDLATANRAVADGHVDLIAMTRAHIADPHIMAKLRDGRADDIRQCVGANYCADFAGQGGLCIQNPATGRERSLPHILPKAARKKRIVVAGGGVGGLEAARCALQRGHDVVLYEAAPELGGQLNHAKRVPKRESLAGIVRWLEQQVRKGGADVRLGESAEAEQVLAEAPDAVFIATGGRPRRPDFEGRDLCVSSWDVIGGTVEPGQNVLVYDEIGLQPGIGCADLIASRGSEVELVSPDRMVAEETGATLHVGYLRRLYGQAAIMTPNAMLVGAYREGNRLIAVLRNLYTGEEEEREADQIVFELGTLPVDDLYQALRPRSRNRGEVDYDALVEGAPQNVVTNPDGAFDLFRVGDALFSRNVHAAMYDSARLMSAL